ncbi:MAG: 2-oxoacid:acceptor oxidoreductase family protein [Clostridiales bacterium]|nr:2-oxoacid:acceptor oxidoreductase family protein [Clostridiales bacterium]
MKDTISILIAGYGGQGILFSGKVVAYAGLIDGKEISWLPSYGPEMRGGSANCTICLSNEPIASPYIQYPDYFMAMNQLAFNKFIPMVEKSGMVVYDSAIINGATDRGDIQVHGLDAVTLAEENGLGGLANMVMTGKLFKELPFCTFASLEKAVEKSVSAGRTQLIELNMKAIQLGMES